MEFSNIVLTKFILNTINNHKLLQNGDKVVLGVSGGIDSLALMDILYHLQPMLSFQLHIATLDHGLRAEQGAKDVEYVKSLSRERQLPYFSGFVDVNAIVQNRKLSIETAAREARYDFLARVAKDVGATKIVVAHHADDQAETILMHLLRGSGLQGIRGMQLQSPVPNHPNLTLIRPLLTVSRAELDAYCTLNGLIPVIDETNTDTQYLRNFIRLEVMPVLNQVNPQLSASLRRLSDNVDLDLTYIQERFSEEVVPQINMGEEQILVPRVLFAQWHPALQRRVVLYAVECLNPDVSLTHYHITEAVRTGLQGTVGALTRFPQGLQLRVDYDNLIIENQDNPKQFPPDELFLPKDTKINLTLPIMAIIEDIQGNSWQFIASDSIRIEDCFAQLSIPPSSNINLRTRQAGDRFKPLGLNGHTKKLKDWMIDRKIPQYLRNHIPILEINDEIGAILMGRQWFICDSYKIVDKTQVRIGFLIDNS